MRRQPYVNWFTKDLWPAIEKTLKGTNFHTGETVKLLRMRHPNPNPGQQYNGGVYEKLSRQTVDCWLTTTALGRKMLKEDVIKTVREMREFQGDSAEFKGRMSLNRGAERVLKGHEELEESLINLVKGMRGGRQPLNAPVLRAVLEGVVEVKAPQLLRSNGGPWGLSENWVKEWICSKLGWSFRVATTAAQKLPKDWEHQLDMMAYRAAFEMLTHGVPVELMVNMDQTAMHLVPSGGS